MSLQNMESVARIAKLKMVSESRMVEVLFMNSLLFQIMIKVLNTWTKMQHFLIQNTKIITTWKSKLLVGKSLIKTIGHGLLHFWMRKTKSFVVGL